MQSASLRDLQGRQEEQSGTKQHRTQHGSSDVGQEKKRSRRTENTQAANTQIYIRSHHAENTAIHTDREYKIMVLKTSLRENVRGLNHQSVFLGF